MLEEEMEQLRGEYEKKVVELKMQETRNGDLKYELAKTTKSYSLELGEKELLINVYGWVFRNWRRIST